MARNVADLRLLFEVMAGSDPGDPMSAPTPVAEISRNQLKNTRIAVLESEALPAATPETRAAVESAAKLLESDGFAVEAIRLSGLDRALDLWWFYFGAVISHLLGQSVAGKESLLSPQLKEYLVSASDPTLSRGGGRRTSLALSLDLDGLLAAAAARDAVRESLIRQISGAVLLSPVSCGPAFRHGGGSYGLGTGYLDTMCYAQWLNLTGFPGASVPVTLSVEGLPIGVQIIGCPYDDELVLAVAQALESVRGPLPHPPIS